MRNLTNWLNMLRVREIVVNIEWRKNTQMITEIIETSTNVYRLYALLNWNANLVLPCYLYITTVVITHTFIPAIRFWLIWWYTSVTWFCQIPSKVKVSVQFWDVKVIHTHCVNTVTVTPSSQWKICSKDKKNILTFTNIIRIIFCNAKHNNKCI
jgi:hypothetical protein